MRLNQTPQMGNVLANVDMISSPLIFLLPTAEEWITLAFAVTSSCVIIPLVRVASDAIISASTIS